ncbi:DUF2917 domain-containing protein [Polaromonas sp.]|uniref:DUF2917 domain-containing protein n=1 Tax=Polaromonas sp. TaxID=1869339 RepID=UPI002FCA5F7E
MSALQSPLKVGLIPQALHLHPGEALTCTRGGVWITSDAIAGDVVLDRGQAFVAQRAADYYVSGLRRHGACSRIAFASQP